MKHSMEIALVVRTRPRVKIFHLLKWTYVLLPVLLYAMMSFAAPTPVAPVFQMRLVVAQGPQSAPPKDAESINLMVTNSSTGQVHGEILWIGKQVLIDQSDLQATTVVMSTPAASNVPGRPEIDVTFTPKGSKQFTEVTRHSINKRLAIIIDGQLVSAPVIKSEITGGKAMISGNFTRDEALALSNKINQALKH